ncbi:helix-turn-helix domain-containing protein [Holospora obtusa]|uniref:helix-turn-helix domain-containing protein n=1 Tax=Holospora obtusa TaxID=49893 RepID=UPI000A017E8D
MNFVKSGNSPKKASRVFGINKMTINRWYLHYKSKGHFHPKIRLGAHFTIEKESFIQY